MTEYTDRIRSKYLGNDRLVWILPPRSGRSDNLTVFLDGEFYRERIGAVELISRLTEGAIADSWFVFVSIKNFEARWIECPCFPPFPRFVVDELLPRLEQCFPEIRSVRRRVLAGLSYTGLAAAYVAKERPGVFQSIISQSGSFWWNDCWLVQAYENTPLGIATDFYLDVGRMEIEENVRQGDVLQVVSQVTGVGRFRDVLIKQGMNVNYREFDGGHDFSCWKKMLPEALRWALTRRPAFAATPAAVSV